jgi:uncharacterized membrane protein
LPGCSILLRFGDGIFAVPMTLLVIDIRTPVATLVHSETDVWNALVALAPELVTYLMSFLTLGIFWVGQQTQLNYLERSERSLTWMHILFLATIAIMPFSTAMLAEFMAYRTALLLYWFNILLPGLALYWSWICAMGLGVIQSETSPTVFKAIKRRIVIAQSLYAFGALLCVFNTYWSIAFIVLVQLNYAIAPRFSKRSSAS